MQELRDFNPYYKEHRPADKNWVPDDAAVARLQADLRAEWDHVVVIPPMRLGHIFEGDISPSGKAGGFHFRPGGEDPPTARMTKLHVTGKFIAKVPYSSFFPDNFTKQQVTDAIGTAFRNSGLKSNGKFIGESVLGFKIEGYYSKKDGIKTAYPIRKGD